MDMSDYEIDYGKGCEKVKKTENPLVLSYTNKAIENVKSRLISKGYEKEEANKLCHTFDSYFCEWNGRDINSLKDKTIFIEEFSMVPNKWMSMIYKGFTVFNYKVYMFGDPMPTNANQSRPAVRFIMTT